MITMQFVEKERARDRRRRFGVTILDSNGRLLKTFAIVVSPANAIVEIEDVILGPSLNEKLHTQFSDFIQKRRK